MGRIALVGAQLLYAVQYYRGVGEESGGPFAAMKDLREFQRAARALGGSEGGAIGLARDELERAVRADHEALQESQAKYGGREASSFAADGIQNIGFQMMIAYRVMRFFRAAGFTLAAKASSRAIRHLYGSDLHWDAAFEPGVVLVHGFGMAIAAGVQVGTGSILFQHVTLGITRDPVSRRSGAPRLEAGVHVGIGASVLGPVTVGAGSKIMAGCTVTENVPAGSIVTAPAPVVQSRSNSP
jgi:serine acetyltransferase